MNGYALAADLLPEDYRRALPPACLEAEGDPPARGAQPYASPGRTGAEFF